VKCTLALNLSDVVSSKTASEAFEPYPTWVAAVEGWNGIIA
jgi:hypothetical protein